MQENAEILSEYEGGRCIGIAERLYPISLRRVMAVIILDRDCGNHNPRSCLWWPQS
jgi:hypothetical protein